MNGDGEPPDDVRDEAGAGASPTVALAGFNGSLAHLLTLARAHTIDLLRLPLGALVDQLVTALRQTPARTPLGQKADWVVMAAWLLQLRSRLLLPADAAVHNAAAADAEALRARLVALQHMQALAGWLARRPQCGHDVFARGRPELFGVSVAARPAIDIEEFLWASLALFDPDPPPQTMPSDRPPLRDLFALAEARACILQRLAGAPDGASLDQLLPTRPAAARSEPPRSVRRRSAWASTLVASLELTKQGTVVMAQADAFQPIHVRTAGQ